MYSEHMLIPIRWQVTVAGTTRVHSPCPPLAHSLGLDTDAQYIIPFCPATHIWYLPGLFSRSHISVSDTGQP